MIISSIHSNNTSLLTTDYSRKGLNYFKDEMLMQDLDLSILGAALEKYKEYVGLIKKLSNPDLKFKQEKIVRMRLTF